MRSPQLVKALMPSPPGTEPARPAHYVRGTGFPGAESVKIEIETSYIVTKPGGPLKVTMKVDGKVVAEGTVPISAPLIFTANDCLDIGIALGSPVSLDYFDKAPFKFNGTIERVHVRYATARQ
jgi:hypothetical protein